MEKQTANKKQTKQNETSQRKSRKRKATKKNSYSKSGATSANRPRANGQAQIDTGSDRIEELAMLSMMLDTLQSLNSTRQEKEMTIVKPSTSYQKVNANAAMLKTDFGSNEANKRQIPQKNATKNKPKKRKELTSGSSVVEQKGPRKPSTYPINDVIAMSMISTSKNAKIEETKTQLATVNSTITTHKKENEPRPCTSVAKARSGVYTSKNESDHRKTPTNADQSKTQVETKKCNASVNSMKTKQKKQDEPNPGKSVTKTQGSIKTTPHHKNDGTIPNKMSTNKIENSHRKTPASPIRSTTHLESIAQNKCKSKQKVPHPKLTTGNATKQKKNKPNKPGTGLNKIKGRKKPVAHLKPDDMRLSKTSRNKNHQTKIIDWDGEAPIGSNQKLVDKTINQKKYLNYNNLPAFEQHVNYLLQTRKQQNINVARKSTVKFKQELTLPCIRDDAQKIVQAKLESFVDQMVEKKVGYLVERSLRVNVHNNKESFVDGTGRKKEGVCIGSIPMRQYALHGDLVKVFVMNKPKVDDPIGSDSVKRKNRTERRDNCKGFVVAILEKRHNRRCVGTLLPQKDSSYRILVPLDSKIPRLRIYNHNLPAELKEMGSTGDATKFYLAEIIEWQDDIPIGANLKSLGQTGLLKIQNEFILMEHNLDASPYADHILAQLPSVPYSIPQEEIVLREDLRRVCTFTIDSATARHLDDALSCKILENGNYEIGVHIADVTYFLREQSELDEVAKLKATSIYMVDNVYRMLPEQLCDVCSLLPGQEKLTFSVFFEILPDGTVVNTRFARSVINSCAKLSYENAQMMINSANGEGSGEDVMQQIFHGYTVQSLSLILCQVHSIAVKLRQRRIEAGFLELDQSRLKFWFDTATGTPTEYDQRKLTTFDVLMVLANTAAAQAIEGALSSSSLIRCSQQPSEKKIEDFVKTMAGHGYTISFASSQTVRESIASIIAEAEHPDAASIVLNKLLAQFKNHQAPTLVYTNFTSPIRRYTDCMVHRVLAAKLGFGEESKRTLEELQELAKTCNMKRNKAKVAGDASLMFCYHQWLKTVQKHETVAAVAGYDDDYIELILLGTGISLKIMTKKISSIARVVFNSSIPINGIQWIPADSSRSPVTLKIFSKVRVTIALVGDHISVCSILPMAAENTSTRESYKNLNMNKKNKLLNNRILLPVVAAITVISSLVVVQKLCKLK